MMYPLRRLSTIGILAAVLFGAAGTAEAAAVPFGATIPIIAGFVRGTAVAYDPIHHVYLVVASGGVVWGRFVAANGTPLGNPFPVQATPQYTHFPIVAFSPDASGGAGGFLVAWHESDLPNANTSVHARMVSYPAGGPYGPENVVNTDGTYWETRIGMAYSTASREFLLGLARAHGAGGYGIRAVRVDNNAAAIAPTFTVAINNQYEDWPSVAYNPVTNQFLVSYAGYSIAGAFAFVNTRLVQAGTNQLIGSGPTTLVTTVGTWITDTVYNPRTNQFLVAWVWGTTAPTLTSGRLVNADATISGNVNVLSTRWASGDGMSVDYNPLTDTYFLVASTNLSAEDGGVELWGATGVPVDNGFLATSGAGRSGRPYPRIKASTQDPNWLISVTNSFATTDIQLITGTSVGPPPPPGPRPMLAVDVPSNNAVVSTRGFAIAGWAVDAGSPTGTGVDNVIAWAYPSTGAPPILAGVANYGLNRPDLGSYLGVQFAPSGYVVNVGAGVLPAGNYLLAVYGHSTVTGSWNAPKTLNISVQAPPSTPKMWIDLPSMNQTITQTPIPVHVVGWAVDLGAASGPGVDVVHVYAFQQGSSTPIFLGWSYVGGYRPDLANWLGPQFANSGYDVMGASLPVGNYSIVVFAHSAVTGTFNNAATINVMVR